MLEGVGFLDMAYVGGLLRRGSINVEDDGGMEELSSVREVRMAHSLAFAARLGGSCYSWSVAWKPRAPRGGGEL